MALHRKLVEDLKPIGVVAVLGSTFDWPYEPVAGIWAALDRLAADTGLDVPVHVDGASGGFVAPFIDPDLAWDFRLPRAQPINASGHKYGLVYPGAGWVIWRDPDALADELVFDVNYPGGDMPALALRIAIGNGVSHDLADTPIGDLRRHVEYLDKLPAPLPRAGTGFGH